MFSQHVMSETLHYFCTSTHFHIVLLLGVRSLLMHSHRFSICALQSSKCLDKFQMWCGCLIHCRNSHFFVIFRLAYILIKVQDLHCFTHTRTQPAVYGMDTVHLNDIVDGGHMPAINRPPPFQFIKYTHYTLAGAAKMNEARIKETQSIFCISCTIFISTRSRAVGCTMWYADSQAFYGLFTYAFKDGFTIKMDECVHRLRSLLLHCTHTLYIVHTHALMVYLASISLVISTPL